MKLIENSFVARQIAFAVLFGLIAGVLGQIQFTLPDFPNQKSNLMELGLLIAILHLRRPQYLLITLLLMTVIWFIASGQEFDWLLFVPRLIIGYGWFYYYNLLLKPNTQPVIRFIAVAIFGLLVYYLTLSFFVGLTMLDWSLEAFSLELLLNLYKAFGFEAVATGIGYILYVLQHNTNLRLKDHLEHVESLVAERTEALNRTVDELNASNMRLSETIKQLEKSQYQLVNNEKFTTLGILTSGLSHVLNNSLNFLNGSSVTLSRNLEDIAKHVALQQPDKQVQETIEDSNTLLKTIHQGTTSVFQVIEHLRAFSLHEKGIPKYVNLVDEMKHVIGLLQYELVSRNVHVELSFDEIPEVECYAGELNHTFVNVLLNAIEATPESESVEVNITQVDNDFLMIQVINPCECGYAETHTANQLMEPFYTTKENHSGLGLSLANSVIEQHQGQMNIDIDKERFDLKIKLPVELSGQ